MITEYKVHLENKTKDELVAFILQLQKQIDEKDKRIKELEEENVILRKANNITRDLIKEVKIEDITQVINKSYEEFVNQFVAKQKIKDKIKELANTKGDLATYIATSERIKVLEELLEEEE